MYLVVATRVVEVAWVVADFARDWPRGTGRSWPDNRSKRKCAERWFIWPTRRREGDFDPQESDLPEPIPTPANGHGGAENPINVEHR